jgi:hypothetical protein
MRERGYCVVYDSGDANQFIMHTSDGLPPHIFKQQSERGLFYMDMLNWDGKQEIALINTVASNKIGT